MGAPYPQRSRRYPARSHARHRGHEVRRHLRRRRRAPQARRGADRRQARGGPPRRRGALAPRQGDRPAHRRRPRGLPHPDPREMDMLLSTGERVSCALCAMAINDLGHRAISLTGSQAGIVTDTSHTKARILDVRADRIFAALDEDAIVLVAGFQGVSTAKDVTTLGRGGSDTTAVALAAAVGAEVCEIYTDVAGRLQRRPADRPRRAQAATSSPSRRCSRWPPRAPACCSCAPSSTPATTACASTADRASTTRPGTVVVSEEETVEHPLITAVTHSTRRGARHAHRRARHARHRRPRHDRARRGERQHRHDHPERARVRGRAARTCRSPSRATTCTPPTPRSSRSRPSSASRSLTDEAMGKVSIVGAGMKSHPGVAAKVFTHARRQRHQHRDDLHLADPHLLRRAGRPACPTPSGRCTPPSSSRARTRSGPSSPSGSSHDARRRRRRHRRRRARSCSTSSSARGFPADEIVAVRLRALAPARSCGGATIQPLRDDTVEGFDVALF